MIKKLIVIALLLNIWVGCLARYQFVYKKQAKIITPERKKISKMTPGEKRLRILGLENLIRQYNIEAELLNKKSGYK